MPTKPQSNLPPQAQPWGRYVEESLANLERGTSINGQNSNNNLRQLNSSVQLLSQQQQDLQTQQNTLTAQQATLASQQAYLETFKTYISSSVNTETVTNYSSNQIWVAKEFSLTFTLTRDCQVFLESIADVVTNADSAYSGAQTVSGTSYSYLKIDSGSYEVGPVNTSTVAGTVYNLQSSRPVGKTKLVTLSAGTHTIWTRWYLYWFASPNPSGGLLRIKDAYLTATVVG